MAFIHSNGNDHTEPDEMIKILKKVPIMNWDPSDKTEPEEEVIDIIKKAPLPDWDASDKMATKAEFVTLIRKNKKKPGCFGFLSSILLLIAWIWKW